MEKKIGYTGYVLNANVLKMHTYVFSGGVARRLMALEDLAWDYIKFSYAPGSYSNMVTKRKLYNEFCTIFQLNPFPLTHWQIVRFATYLSLWFTSVHSIKNYVSGICMLNELNGFDKVTRGALYRNVIRGIRRELRACCKQALPITRKMLIDICDIVDVDNQKELAIWVSLLFGSNLFLHKSNLVPNSRTHEPQFQISCRDIRFHDGILITFIKWSKTNQFGEKPLYLPMVINQKSEICPVKWCMFMVHRIPARTHHNLFCFRGNGQTLPITYYDLNTQLHKWLSKIGITNYH